MKIGVTQKDYPIQRNILNAIPNAEYVLLRKNNNLFHSLSTVKKLLTGKKLNFEGQYYFWQKPKLDILHLFNDVNYSSQKWVSSFETLVPRFAETKNDHQKSEPSHIKNSKTENAIKQILKPNCLGIIAFSQNSYDIQAELLGNYPKLKSKTLEKLNILPPPQKVLFDNGNRNITQAEVLKLIFVGSEFHRKGGVEMYEVLKKLKEKYNFKLTVISSFRTDHYVTKVTEEEAKRTRELLANEGWIDIYESIPNEKVLELIKESHIGLLPTWSDTYGFSVLEMQACGVPVITTDIRALPEINNNDCGWLIHLPQNRLKQALYFNEEQKEILKSTLKEQLEKILIDIFENREQIAAKAEKSLERIRKEHAPDDFSNKLMKIYNP